jgi:hypothetical protein
MVCAGLLLLVALGGTAVWAAVRPGGYGRSSNGCVNVSVASSTGGAILHRCGPDARTWCAAEFSQHDQLAALVQAQCRLAGIVSSKQ